MPAGAKPGERRGGREVGTPNRLTPDIRAMAQAFLDKQGGVEAILAKFMECEDPDLRFKVITMALHYGFGKPKNSRSNRSGWCNAEFET